MFGIRDLIESAATTIGDIFDGRKFELQLDGGPLIVVSGIHQAARREAEVGEYGVTTWATMQTLDLHRGELRRLGIRDPENELVNAALGVDGEPYIVESVRDGDMHARCVLLRTYSD